MLNIDREDLLSVMVNLLQEALDEEDEGVGIVASASEPLVGDSAVVSSLTLVTFVTDLESLLAEKYDADLLLVSEEALSRSKSPFRTIDSLLEYILEIASAA